MASDPMSSPMSPQQQEQLGQELEQRYGARPVPAGADCAGDRTSHTEVADLLAISAELVRKMQSAPHGSPVRAKLAEAVLAVERAIEVQ